MLASKTYGFDRFQTGYVCIRCRAVKLQKRCTGSKTSIRLRRPQSEITESILEKRFHTSSSQFTFYNSLRYSDLNLCSGLTRQPNKTTRRTQITKSLRLAATTSSRHLQHYSDQPSNVEAKSSIGQSLRNLLTQLPNKESSTQDGPDDISKLEAETANTEDKTIDSKDGEQIHSKDVQKKVKKKTKASNSTTKKGNKTANKREPSGVRKASSSSGRVSKSDPTGYAISGNALNELEQAFSGTSLKKALTKKAGKEVQNLEAEFLSTNALDIDERADVPGLTYGLDRVLFNPGVYHLQDPRSKVFNFDPYLEKIMPVSEFDFNALKEYVTSSKDKSLYDISKRTGKKYMGSSSSMTGVLAHFHFLLSQWRPIDVRMLSQGFPDKLRSFTQLQRAPAAVFLRHRDGSYAIDADKEFDSANILSMLGKSMEKLLTLPRGDYERYRRSNPESIGSHEKESPEAFHYTTMGDLLMRSQLDAFDPRLPGSGMFDLKTRAVVSIRMDSENYQKGMGYQIKQRFGAFESFEREYFDMIRSAFLKYSLQVRMGRMDGIFVAFHNTERIFGFQYVSLDEMDTALHGSTNTKLGDQEFKLSLNILNQILERATSRFPNQSLRFHFETRDCQTPFMYIFAEPVMEEQIDRIQQSNKADVEAFERSILGLGSEKPEESAQQSSDEDKAEKEWDRLQAKVETEMEHDELFPQDSNAKPATLTTNEQPSNNVDEDASSAAQLSETGDEDEEEAGQDAGQIGEDEEQEEEDDDADGDEDESEINADENLESGDEQAESTPDSSTSERRLESTHELTSDSLPSSECDQIPPGPQEKAEPMNDQQDGDKSWLDDVAREQTRPDSNPNLLAMTLMVRNKVNNSYVTRPETLGENDRWSIEYSLTDVPSASRAWSLYEACQVRRAKRLDPENDEENHYQQFLQTLSTRGRQWRKAQDESEAKKGRVVFDEAHGKDSPTS